MAKKHKRRAQARPQTPTPRSETAARSEVRPTVAPPPPPAQQVGDLAHEYRYVIGDLKRVGLLAAAMLALLVVLALIAQYAF